MIGLWDGARSLIAAVLTAAICGIPAWFSHKAVQAGVAPLWTYAAVAALIFVGLVMTAAFLRKAGQGISPGRARRR